MAAESSLLGVFLCAADCPDGFEMEVKNRNRGGSHRIDRRYSQCERERKTCRISPKAVILRLPIAFMIPLLYNNNANGQSRLMYGIVFEIHQNIDSLTESADFTWRDQTNSSYRFCISR